MNQPAKIYPAFRWAWVGLVVISTATLILFAISNSRKAQQEALSLKDLMQSYPPVQIMTEEPGAASGAQSPQVVPLSAPAAVIKAAVPEPSPPVVAVPKPYAIQLYSFKDLDRAKATLEDLNKKNFPAYLMTQDLKDKGIWHKIWVGEYATRDEALSGLVDMRKSYPDCFIVTK